MLNNSFVVFAWKTKRFAFTSFLHLLLHHDFSGILGNLEQKNILQNITHLIQYTVFEIQFRSVKCITFTLGYAKISSNFPAFHSHLCFLRSSFYKTEYAECQFPHCSRKFCVFSKTNFVLSFCFRICFVCKCELVCLCNHFFCIFLWICNTLMLHWFVI